MTAARPDTWMPLYWGDYLRDTGHLNAMGHGAYLMLIKHYWCSGTPLANDDDGLWRIACCDSKREWLKLRPKIERFFKDVDGAWHHKRIDAELARANAMVAAKAEAGKRGAEKRWQKDGTPIADPPISHRQTDTPSPSPSHTDSLRESSSGEPIPLMFVRADDWPKALFGSGLEWLMKETGKPEGKLRPVLGKLLKKCGGDHEAVFRLLIEAQNGQKADPVGWLMAASMPKPKSKTMQAVDALQAELGESDAA